VTINRAYTIRFTNENTEAWIKTTADGKVFSGSNNVIQHVLSLTIADAITVLESRGWEVEDWQI